MEGKEGLESLRAALAGRPVTDRQLAGSSLSIWIDTRPDEKVGFIVTLGPTWQLRGPAGVVAGSRQAEDDEHLSGWAAVPAAIEAILGQTVESLEVEPGTGDLTLRLGGGFVARTFDADPRELELWRVRDVATGEVVTGTPAGVRASAP
jgi:hypothetical protein